MKVICAGLSKTGTKSLAKALRMLGFTVFDYFEHIKPSHLDEWFDFYSEGKTPDFASLYKDVDAVTDLPPAFWFQEIYEAFPDAKVILSLRDSEDVWVQSWVKQNDKSRLVGFVNTVLIKWPMLIKHRLRGKRRTLWNAYEMVINAAFGSLNSKSTVLFKKKYREHNERVQAVIPKEKLLIYNVKQGWKPLCEFLGCEIPEQEFPRENVGASYSDVRIVAKLQRIKRNLFVAFAIFALLASVFYMYFAYYDQ